MFTSRRTRAVFAIGALAVATLALSACGSSASLAAPKASAASKDDKTIVVGSQAYYSNEIIAEIYAEALEAAGFKVDRKFNIGQRDAYIPEVKSGAIDLFPEYTGNLLEFLDHTATATSPKDVYTALKGALPKGLTALDYAAASDQDTYTVLKSTADKYGLKTIADLKKVTPAATLGGAPELEKRPYGPAGAKKAYGVDLGFSATGPSTLESLLAGKVQVADIYTADPAFQTQKIVALADPDNLILASNVVPIVSSDIASDVDDVINAVSAKLDAKALVALNVQSTVDQKSPADIAAKWLKENKLR